LAIPKTVTKSLLVGLAFLTFSLLLHSATKYFFFAIIITSFLVSRFERSSIPAIFVKVLLFGLFAAFSIVSFLLSRSPLLVQFAAQHYDEISALGMEKLNYSSNFLGTQSFELNAMNFLPPIFPVIALLVFFLCSSRLSTMTYPHRVMVLAFALLLAVSPLFLLSSSRIALPWVIFSVPIVFSYLERRYLIGDARKIQAG
jgi:hypothetical protein